jgi:hypothetical protein
MKIIFQLTAVLYLSTYINVVFAHGEENLGTLGSTTSGKTATDVWQVTCTKGPEKPGLPIVTPTRLAFHVRDELPKHPATVSIQAFKGTLKSGAYIDPIDGDAIYGPSGFVSLRGGVGTYLLKISKSASTLKGIERYRPQFHCWSNVDKQHSTISYRLIQNQ